MEMAQYGLTFMCDNPEVTPCSLLIRCSIRLALLSVFQVFAAIIDDTVISFD